MDRPAQENVDEVLDIFFYNYSHHNKRDDSHYSKLMENTRSWPANSQQNSEDKGIRQSVFFFFFSFFAHFGPMSREQSEKWGEWM
jgi:hypothetical protein